MYPYDRWPHYVPVAKRRADALREIERLCSSGTPVEPVKIQGRKIARSFWGAAWCAHLERFSDFDNRLPRGRTYVRNGSVCHLAIDKGKVEAIVSGSTLYRVTIRIAALPRARWRKIQKQCAGRIGSMLELLQGRFSSHVMEIVTEPHDGLFPKPAQIEFDCDCPDWAVMCKHVAAVLYGVGARLDQKPELLFVLRKVDHQALISADLDLQGAAAGKGKRRRLGNQDLSSVFGIDIEDTRSSPVRKRPARRKNARRPGTERTTGKKTAPGKTAAHKTKAAARKRAFTPTGAAVRQLRKHYGMTRSQFAERIGVSSQTIANWENCRGKLKLQARTLAALTRAWLRKQSG